MHNTRNTWTMSPADSTYRCMHHADIALDSTARERLERLVRDRGVQGAARELGLSRHAVMALLTPHSPVCRDRSNRSRRENVACIRRSSRPRR